MHIDPYSTDGAPVYVLYVRNMRRVRCSVKNSSRYTKKLSEKYAESSSFSPMKI